jgi:Uma2 family endonuclease
MAVLILDPIVSKRIRKQMEDSGEDRHNEVWEGEYVVPPLANNQHQHISYKWAKAIDLATGSRLEDTIFPGVNVSDRVEGWTENYRCPDVAVFLAGNPARDCGTHWCGGPDFLIEILSPGDRSRDKLPFYAAINVREVLILDRDPWRMELYRRQDGQLVEVGRTDPTSTVAIASEVLTLTFAFGPGTDRPAIIVAHPDGRTWRV